MRIRSILALSLLLLPSSLGAQMRSQSRGFMLNLHAVGASIKGEDWDKSEGGAGLGLIVGYGFSPTLMVYIGGDAVDINPDIGEPYVFGHGEFGVRYTFSNSQKPFVPFAQVAFSSFNIDYANLINGREYDIMGPALSLTGGASFYLARAFALEFSGALAVGKFTRASVDGGDPTSLGADKFNAHSGRINAGLSWHPSKKPN